MIPQALRTSSRKTLPTLLKRLLANDDHRDTRAQAQADIAGAREEEYRCQSRLEAIRRARRDETEAFEQRYPAEDRARHSGDLDIIAAAAGHKERLAQLDADEKEASQGKSQAEARRQDAEKRLREAKLNDLSVTPKDVAAFDKQIQIQKVEHKTLNDQEERQENILAELIVDRRRLHELQRRQAELRADITLGAGDDQALAELTKEVEAEKQRVATTQARTDPLADEKRAVIEELIRRQDAVDAGIKEQQVHRDELLARMFQGLGEPIQAEIERTKRQLVDALARSLALESLARAFRAPHQRRELELLVPVSGKGRTVDATISAS